jgi:hypothetical protein
MMRATDRLDAHAPDGDDSSCRPSRFSGPVCGKKWGATTPTLGQKLLRRATAQVISLLERQKVVKRTYRKLFTACVGRHMRRLTIRYYWSWTESNRRPLECDSVVYRNDYERLDKKSVLPERRTVRACWSLHSTDSIWAAQASKRNGARPCPSIRRRTGGHRCAGHRCAGHRCAGHRCAGHVRSGGTCMIRWPSARTPSTVARN